MAGLLDFLQAASNSAASNVSAPVDGIAWLLRKAGIPVPEDAVGGSKWMEQKGLTKPVQQSGASLAGETVGLLSPMVAAAKAPQIAKGLLTMGENAAAPQLLRNDKGAIVWHGSPHKFDRFDSSKIGTGEGAQAYGHGLYLAESEDVGRSYQQVLASPRNRVMDKAGVYIEPSPMGDGKYRLARLSEWGKMKGQVGDGTQGLTDYQYPNLAAAMRAAKQQGYLSKSDRPVLHAIGEDGKYVPISKAADTEALLGYEPQYAQFIASDPGYLYKVDLPDTAIARMLDWDKPLSQQAPDVALALEALRERAAKSMPEVAKGDPLGRGVYTAYQAHRGGNQAAVSDRLRELGIPGIRYLDGGSRGAGSGTSNFVVFPGEEGLLKILERNGQGL